LLLATLQILYLTTPKRHAELDSASATNEDAFFLLTTDPELNSG